MSIKNNLFIWVSFPKQIFYLVGEPYFGQHKRPKNCENVTLNVYFINENFKWISFLLEWLEEDHFW